MIILLHLCQSVLNTRNQHYQHSPSMSSAGSSNICMNKRGQRERASEGLTKNMKRVKDSTSKQLHFQLNKDANYIRFTWVEFTSKDYFKVIDAINDCYKRMLEIGKCTEVFQLACGGQPDILMAKSRVKFSKEKKTYS